MMLFTHPLWPDVALRIAAATLVGAGVGLNRDLHHKSVGVRTMGLVAVASCMLVLSATQYALAHGANSADSASRVTQGIVSGIGFLGAGVILRGPDQVHVLGLTTAAAVLLVAAMGVACALAVWPILIAGFLATLFLLTVCGWLDHKIQGRPDREP
jgi:putative Mg2+ transporter-C (MgtC) family protein